MKHGKKLQYSYNCSLKTGKGMIGQKPSEDIMAKSFQKCVKDIKTKIKDSLSINRKTSS